MAKFNLGLGTGLLNEASQAMKTSKEFNIIPIDINNIDPSEDNNGMSLNDIDELAQSILENGMDQNLVVIQKPDGHYKLLTGHRRRLALLKLVNDGHSEFAQVPCLVKNLDNIKFDISQSAKEKFALITTNIQNRNRTLADNLHLMKLADEVFAELKATGVDTGKRREWVANQLGVSPSYVRDLTAIEKKAAPEVKKAIEEDKIPLTAATEIVQHSEEDQKVIIEKSVAQDEPISVETVRKIVTEKKATETPTTAPAKKTKKSYADEFQKDADVFIDNLKSQKKSAKTALLNKTDYDKIVAAQSIIYKQLQKIEGILDANQTDD